MTRIEDVPKECVSLRTRMAARTVTRKFDEALRPLGLKATQFTLLVAIRQGVPKSIAALADGLAMERTSLTRNLKLLERDGLIVLGNEGYRRSRTITLTQVGEDTLTEALPIWRTVQDKIIGKLDHQQWQMAKSILESLAKDS